MKKYVKYVGNAVSALSILFIVWALRRVDFDFGRIKDWRMAGIVFAAGIALKTATVFLSASAWCLWLEFFAGKRCNRREALRVYAKANIGKYLPGNVMHYAGRNLFAGRLNLSQKQIAAATLSEIAGLVFAAFFMGAVLAYSEMCRAIEAVMQNLQKACEPVTLKLLFIVILGLTALAMIFIFKAVRKQRYNIQNGKIKSDNIPNNKIKSDSIWNGKIKSDKIPNSKGKNDKIWNDKIKNIKIRNDKIKNDKIRYDKIWNDKIKNDEIRNNKIKNGVIKTSKIDTFLKTFLAVFFIYAAVLTVLGLIFVLLYWYWGGSLNGTGIRVITAAYIISWILGFAVPGAPGGIGVREMALTLLLSPVIGRDVTAALSVLHRIITIIGDFAAYLLRNRL